MGGAVWARPGETALRLEEARDASISRPGAFFGARLGTTRPLVGAFFGGSRRVTRFLADLADFFCTRLAGLRLLDFALFRVDAFRAIERPPFPSHTDRHTERGH